jgi:hypothetical protein
MAIVVIMPASYRHLRARPITCQVIDAGHRHPHNGARLAGSGAGQGAPQEGCMPNINGVIDGYFAVWNETDPQRRRDLIAQTWSEDASYLDPLLAAEGHDGIDAMVAALHAQLPGHAFRQVGAPDVHHDRVRFAWELVGEASGTPVYAGTDFGVVAADGRLRAITGFLDRTPAPPDQD